MKRMRIPMAAPERMPPEEMARLEEAVLGVLHSGEYIGGAQVEALELELAAAAGYRHCVGVSSGTDALWLLGAAMGIGPGDAVFVPSFTFSATAEAFALLGAEVIPADVQEDTFNLCPDSLRKAVALCRQEGKRIPRAVVAVDLFGQPADYGKLGEICKKEGLLLLRDSAQSFGCQCPPEWEAERFPRCISFFPTKPLGGIGDGGAVFLQEDGLYERLLSLREHGKGRDRYHPVRLGRNARLDAIQAACLRVKLRSFRDSQHLRERLAVRYSLALGPYAKVPVVQPGCVSAWAQYTLRLKKEEQRDRIQRALAEKGIGSAVYYPVPLHHMPMWEPKMELPVSEKLSRTALSLPIGPHVTDCQADEVCAVIRETIAKGG